jgi:hypothetical protein
MSSRIAGKTERLLSDSFLLNQLFLSTTGLKAEDLKIRCGFAGIGRSFML